jgi:hypothetical protein
MSNAMYKEGEEYVIGQIAMYTGNLFIVDDVAASYVPVGTNCINLRIDNDEGARLLPIIATRQNGKRYVLIPLDDAVDIPTELTETVQMETDSDDPE